MEPMELDEILRIAVANGASDVHLRAGLPPMFRMGGEFIPLRDAARLTPEDTARIGSAMMSKPQRERFAADQQVDTSYGIKGLARFRANVYRQRTTVAVALRLVPEVVPSLEQLKLPGVIERLANERDGLVAIAGPASSGKSTTLATMIDHINTQRAGHILTIEDPIEFMHRDKRSVLSQREIGTDAPSMAAAIEVALRQDPDVLVIGELRDDDTIRRAVAAASSGPLVLTTIATGDTVETVQRLVSAYAVEQHAAIRQQLATVLRGIVCQRLITGRDDGIRFPLAEILVSTERIREILRHDGRFQELRDAMISGRATHGTQTYDQSLFQAHESGLLTREQALRHCTNPDEFALQFAAADAESR